MVPIFIGNSRTVYDPTFQGLKQSISTVNNEPKQIVDQNNTY